MKARNVLKAGLVAVALAGSAFTSTAVAQAGVNRPNVWFNSSTYETQAECDAWGQYHAGPHGIHDWLSYNCTSFLDSEVVCNLGYCAKLQEIDWQLEGFAD